MPPKDTIKAIQSLSIQKIYSKTSDWLATYGPRVIFAIILLFVGQWLISLLRKWLRTALHARHIHPSLQPFFLSLTSTLLQVLLLIGLMQIMGIEMTIFGAIVGGITVAAGLALSGTLQNFTSGVLILFLKPFIVGDNIALQGVEGTVTAIEIFFTTMITYDNKTVIIPNSKLSNEIIVNLSRQGKRRLDIDLKFSYAFTFREIQQVILTTISNSLNLLTEPAARVGIHNLESDGYVIMINVWAPAHGFEDARQALHQNIIEDLKKAGIKLPGMP